jgi:phosphocarrier protein
MAPRDIDIAASWQVAVTRAIEQSRAIIVLLSHHSNRSDYVAAEVAVAFKRKLKIVPVVIEDVQPGPSLEIFLATTQWESALAAGPKARFQKVVEKLRVQFGHSRPKTPVPQPPPPPSFNSYVPCVATAKVANRLGLHARPCMDLVDAATAFESEISVQCRDTKHPYEADAKSIMAVMMLAAPKDTVLRITARGPDARDACEALAKLIESGFDED